MENFDRLYGLSERWGKLLQGIYEVIRDLVRIDLEDQGLTGQNIEQYLIRNLESISVESKPEGEYLNSQFLQWLQKNRLETLRRELTISSIKDSPSEDC